MIRGNDIYGHGVLHEKTLRGPKYGYRSPHYFKIASWDEYYNIAMSAALLLLSILYALLRQYRQGRMEERSC